MKAFCSTLIIAIISHLSGWAQTTESDQLNQNIMRLKITIGDKNAEAILYENAASMDFAGLLPLTLKLDDYAQTEKVVTLPKKLSIVDAPSGFKPEVGDITYYSPWGNMALFYKAFPYATGLVSLGKITSGVEYFKVKGVIDNHNRN